LLLVKVAGLPSIVLGEEAMAGEYALFSCHLPSGWSSSAELPVVDAIPPMADTALENEAAVKGSIMLVSRGTVPFYDKVKRASAAGAAAVVVFNTEDELFKMSADDGCTSDIPVLMIKSSDAPRLRNHGRARLRKLGRIT
jgi:hypothetical protein